MRSPPKSAAGMTEGRYVGMTEGTYVGMIEGGACRDDRVIVGASFVLSFRTLQSMDALMELPGTDSRVFLKPK